MTSLKKQKLKKVSKGIGVAIIIYIMVSILATKIVYDFVFQRQPAQIVQNVHHYKNNSDVTYKSFSYSCGDSILRSTLYSQKQPNNDLIVIVPGFNAQKTTYEGIIFSFVKEGFDVFAFDPTGHGESGGKSSMGFPQIINDIDSTLDFINNNNDFKYDNIFLLGHSRGGYGVCCTMNNYPNVAAAVSVNGVDTSMDAIMAYSTQYAGKIAYANYPFLNIYQDIIFGRETSSKSAIEEINKSKIPVLIIQSENDEQIPKDKYSIYSNKQKSTAQNTEFLLYNKTGYDGHSSIFYNEQQQPNSDIVKIISDFYKKTSDKDLLK